MDIWEFFKGPKPVVFFAQGLVGEGDRELLILDASISETHTSTLKATTHPVEDGSNIGDHLILNPLALSIEGIVSDSPFTLAAAAVGAVAGLPSMALGGKVGAAGTALASFAGSRLIAGSTKKSVTAYNALMGAQRRKVLFKVVTGLTTYFNMVLENLNTTRVSANSKSFRFTGTLKHIVTVESETVTIPLSALDGGVKHSANKSSKLGKQGVNDASASVEGKGSSILAKIGRGLFG